MAAPLIPKLFSEKILLFGLNSRQFLNKFHRFCGGRSTISAYIDNSIGKPLKYSNLFLFPNLNTIYFTRNSRNFASSDSFAVEKDAIAKEWHFPDEFLHTLSVNCCMDLKIRPCTTLGSSAVVRLMALRSHQDSVTSDVPKVQIFNDGNGILSLNAEVNTVPGYSLLVEVPNRCAIMELKIAGKGNVDMVQMECNQVDICMQEGDFKCTKMKCGFLTVKCEGGNISSTGSFHGSCNLETKRAGNILLDRFQGPNMNLKTENGDIEIKAVYCERSRVQTTKGNVSLANLHADCKVTSIQGNIHANGLTGRLTAETGKGNITVQVSITNGIHLVSNEGNIDIKLSENIDPLLDVVGETVSLDPRYLNENRENAKGGECPNVNARCLRGKISIGVQDWLSSLNLKT